MIVLVLTACPQGLRGHLTRWLMEISAGVFVGKLNPKLRSHVWDLVIEENRGKAIMVYPDRSTEQGYSFLTQGNDWVPEEIEGLTLIRRPGGRRASSLRKGWSTASRFRRKR